MVGVAGLEPAASWSRRFGSRFNGHFLAHLALFAPAVVAFQTSLLQCFRPLPAWSGSAFGSALKYEENLLRALPKLILIISGGEDFDLIIAINISVGILDACQTAQCLPDSCNRSIFSYPFP